MNHCLQLRSGAASGAVLLLTALSCLAALPAAEPESRVEDMSHPPVKVTFEASPALVRLDRDILLTIRIEAPSEMDVTLPPLSGRLAGFTLGGMYTKGPSRTQGKVTTEHHVRLTPDVVDEYRIAPIALRYTDRSVSPPKSGWFATRAMVFETVPAFKGDPGNRIEVMVEPVWIRPSLKTVLLYALLGAAGLVFPAILWRLSRRIRRRVQLMRMSPRERALKELEYLLEKRLVEKGKVKDFYLELTMIVRGYIERQHAVRAPEQTTEEFLAAVTMDPRFAPAVVAKLKVFLQAADLVKFAAHKPTEADINAATESAREYVKTDAADT